MEILTEFLPVINSINFYINVQDPDQVVNINVERNEIVLNKSDSKTNIELCKGIFLKPNFLSGLRRESDWLSFRVQLEEKTRIVNSVLGELIGEISNMNLDDGKKENQLLDHPMCIHCRSCGKPLTLSLTIKSLRPLPSVDWDSMSENWFCHLHDSDKQSMKKMKIAPNDDECFYSEMLFCVNSKTLLVNNSENFLTCDNCSLTIGLLKDNTAKFWVYDIKFVADNILLTKSASEILVSLFHNLDKDSLGANSRLVLEKCTKPKKFIFLVTMDTHLTLLVSENSPLLFVGDSQACKGGNKAYLTKKLKPSCNEQTAYKLKKIKVIKVLYRVKLGEDDESGSWVDDVNIHMLPCGESLFNSVLSLLENSNDCLPLYLKIANDMKIGYVVKQS